LEQRFGFALADIGGNIGEWAFLAGFGNDSYACGMRQGAHLVAPIGFLVRVGTAEDQDGALSLSDFG
jgi:hypothetical protein